MVRVKENLIGRRFERLLVIEQVEDYVSPSGTHKAQWLCECSCDERTKIIVVGQSLKHGYTKSCGCIRKEKTANRGKDNHKTNNYDLSGEFGIGWTTNTNKEFYFDLEDYDKIKDCCWYERIQPDGYSSLCTSKSGRGKNLKMSELIGYKNYDHINRNPLDNRSCNFRRATSLENARNRSLGKNNTSGFIGVSWDKSCQKWTASIRVNKKQLYLGNFMNKNDAIKARLSAEQKYFGIFAPQRHLFEEYGITTINEI